MPKPSLRSVRGVLKAKSEPMARNSQESRAKPKLRAKLYIEQKERSEEVSPSPENCENSYTWNRAICRVEAKICLFPVAIQTFADDGSGSHFDPIQTQLGVFENVVNSPMGSWAKPQLLTILVHFKRMHYFGVAWIDFFRFNYEKKH